MPSSNALFNPLTFFPGVKTFKPCFNPVINQDLKKYIDASSTSSSTSLKPREHQAVTFKHYHKSRLLGKDSVVLHQATGSGKTFVASTLMTQLSGKKLFLVPTTMLEIQTQKSLVGYYPDVKTSVVKKAFSKRAIAKLNSVSEKWNKLLEDSDIIITTYQWYQQYFGELNLNSITAVYCDEFHNALSPERSTMIRHIQLHGCSIIGLTATPISTTKRLDGRGFNSCYKLLGYETEGRDSIVRPFNLLDAIDAGVNTPVATALVKFSDSDAITFSGSNEISEKNAAKQTNRQEYNKAIVELCLNGRNPRNYHSHRTEQGIVFCSGIKHAAAVAKTFQQNLSIEALDSEGGLQQRYNQLDASLRERLGEFSVAEAITSDLSKNETQLLLEKFKKGGIWILVGCDMVIEGMDNPYVAFIVNARPTRSLIIAKQRLGRALRTLPSDVPNGHSKVCMAYDIVWGRKTKISYCFQLLNTQPQGDIHWQYGEFKGQKADSEVQPEPVYIEGAATATVRYKPVIDQAMKAKLLSLIKTEGGWNVSKGNVNKHSEKGLDLSEMHSELTEKTSTITEEFSKLITLLSADTSQTFDSELHYAAQAQASVSTAGAAAVHTSSSVSSQPPISSIATSTMESQAEASWISHLFDEASSVSNVAEIKEFLVLLEDAKRLVNEVQNFLRSNKTVEERAETSHRSQPTEKEVGTLYRKFKVFIQNYLKTTSRLKKALTAKLETTDELTFVNNSFDFNANDFDRIQLLLTTDATIQQELFQVSEEFEQAVPKSQKKSSVVKSRKNNKFSISDDAPIFTSELDISGVEFNLKKSVNNFEELRVLLTELIQSSCLSYLIFEDAETHQLRSVNANDFLWGEEELQQNFNQERANEILMLFHTCCRIETQSLRWHDKQQNKPTFEKTYKALFAILNKFHSKPVVSHYLAIYFLERGKTKHQFVANLSRSKKYLDYAIKRGCVMSHMLNAIYFSRKHCASQSQSKSESAFIIFINKVFLFEGKQPIDSLGRYKEEEGFLDKFTRLLTPQLTMLLDIYTIEELFDLSTEVFDLLGLQNVKKNRLLLNRVVIPSECLKLLQGNSIKECIENDPISVRNLTKKIHKLSFFISPWYLHLLREQLVFLFLLKIEGKRMIETNSVGRPRQAPKIPYFAPNVRDLFLKANDISILQLKMASLITQNTTDILEGNRLTTLALIMNTQLTTAVKNWFETVLKKHDAFSCFKKLEEILCGLQPDEQSRILELITLFPQERVSHLNMLNAIAYKSSTLLRLQKTDLSSSQKQFISSLLEPALYSTRANYYFSITFMDRIVLDPSLKASNFTVSYLHDVISMLVSHRNRGYKSSSYNITLETFNKFLYYHRQQLSRWEKVPDLKSSKKCKGLLKRTDYTIMLKYLYSRLTLIPLKGEQEDIFADFCALYATLEPPAKPRPNTTFSSPLPAAPRPPSTDPHGRRHFSILRTMPAVKEETKEAEKLTQTLERIARSL